MLFCYDIRTMETKADSNRVSLDNVVSSLYQTQNIIILSLKKTKSSLIVFISSFSFTTTKQLYNHSCIEIYGIRFFNFPVGKELFLHKNWTDCPRSSCAPFTGTAGSTLEHTRAFGSGSLRKAHVETTLKTTAKT